VQGGNREIAAFLFLYIFFKIRYDIKT
jgi:hypothetical protein